MGGIDGADVTCNQEARDAGLTVVYRAFLSSGQRNIDSVLLYPDTRHFPVVNLKVKGAF